MTAEQSEEAPSERRLGEVGNLLRVPEVEDVDVILVDDDATTLALLTAFLRGAGHPVRDFVSPNDALDAIRTAPPKILVTDIVMEGMTGLSLAEEARSIDPDISVIFLTGSEDNGTARAALSISPAETITKPVEERVLSRAIQRAFLRRASSEYQRAMVHWMRSELARNAEQIREVTLGTLASLINALDARSAHFSGHSRAVAMQAAAVAQALDLDADTVEAVRTAGLLHDIGMVGVPDAIIHKPAALTPEELKVVRSHCRRGAEIIEPMRHLDAVCRYVLEHHERFDGSGYPDGKTEDQITLGGQIVGIAEAWTALLEGRAYRTSTSREEGMQLLQKHKGRWFSEQVTDALMESDMGLLG